MPKIRTNRTKPPPEGYEDIADILEDYAKKMRDAENDTHEGKRKAELLSNERDIVAQYPPIIEREPTDLSLDLALQANNANLSRSITIHIRSLL
jgi:hypothetical protein